ncbi:MAG: tRNA 2-thiouridine(34) synthase MnmA [Candidatus Pacebacteria bacterium]|nr:tRNA 2-thiouridine(34) synthase MnmA [Candidatus Paceibacterota bacterium]MDR3583150.1 tRNA 2-thiouridine(34) synthase MnmA [Candidatus Paceibacterota bacterium]
MPKKEKVAVGLSGGVDSAVAAALLKKDGYDVTGVFLLTQNGIDAKDVKNICAELDIPLEIIDARKRFQKEVVGYFLKEYSAGRTPNPCVFCNENFKFKLLFEAAEKLGADYVSTGHYVRIKQEIRNPNIEIRNKSKIINSKLKKSYKLFSAKDKNKDQSYFLYRIGQKELARLIFPLGEYEKTEVRELARKFKLPVQDKAESQDVCFLAGMTTEKFLEKNIKSKKGKIVDEQGEVLGEHRGLPLYTLGQRKGINIGGTGPYYVLGKNCEKNILIVTNDKRQLPLLAKTAILEQTVFPAGLPVFPAKVLIRTRYRNPLSYAIIKPDLTRKYIVEFEKPQRAVTPGQSCVFYSEDGSLIGGGIIK